MEIVIIIYFMVLSENYTIISFQSLKLLNMLNYLKNNVQILFIAAKDGKIKPTKTEFKESVLLKKTTKFYLH